MYDSKGGCMKDPCEGCNTQSACSIKNYQKNDVVECPCQKCLVKAVCNDPNCDNYMGYYDSTLTDHSKMLNEVRIGRI